MAVKFARAKLPWSCKLMKVGADIAQPFKVLLNSVIIPVFAIIAIIIVLQIKLKCAKQSNLAIFS